MSLYFTLLLLLLLHNHLLIEPLVFNFYPCLGFQEILVSQLFELRIGLPEQAAPVFIVGGPSSICWLLYILVYCVFVFSYVLAIQPVVERFFRFLSFPLFLPIVYFMVYFGLIYIFFVGFRLQLSRLLVPFGLFDVHNLELYRIYQMIKTSIELLLSQFLTLIIFYSTLHDFFDSLLLLWLLLWLLSFALFVLKYALPYQFSLPFELSFLFSFLLVHHFHLLSSLFSILLSLGFFLFQRHLLSYVELLILVIFQQFPQFVLFVALDAASIFLCIFQGESLLDNIFEITL